MPMPKPLAPVTAIAVGTSVLVGFPVSGVNNVGSGVVTGIQIGEGNVLAFYRVAWWDGRTRREEWLSPTEVAPAKNPPADVRIGFTAEQAKE